jgi:hypothetical protein
MDLEIIPYRVLGYKPKFKEIPFKSLGIPLIKSLRIIKYLGAFLKDLTYFRYLQLLNNKIIKEKFHFSLIDDYLIIIKNKKVKEMVYFIA